MDWNNKFILIGILILCSQIILVISSGYNRIQSTTSAETELSSSELGKLFYDEVIKYQANNGKESVGFLDYFLKLIKLSSLYKKFFVKPSAREVARKTRITIICNNNGFYDNLKPCVKKLSALFLISNFDLGVVESVMVSLRRWYDVEKNIEISVLEYVITYPITRNWEVRHYCLLLNGINTVVLKNTERLTLLKAISSRTYEVWKDYFHPDIMRRFQPEIAIPKMMLQQSTIAYYDAYLRWNEITARNFKIVNGNDPFFDIKWKNFKFGCPFSVIEVLTRLLFSLSLFELEVYRVYDKMCLDDFYLNWKDEYYITDEFDKNDYETYHALDQFVTFAINHKLSSNIITFVLADGFKIIKTIHEEKFTPDLKENLVDMNEIKSIISDCTTEDEICIKLGITSLYNFREKYKIGRSMFNEIRSMFDSDRKRIYLIGTVISMRIDFKLHLVYKYVFTRLLHLLRTHSYEYSEILLKGVDNCFDSKKKDAFDLLLTLHLYNIDQFRGCISGNTPFTKNMYEKKLEEMKIQLSKKANYT